MRYFIILFILMMSGITHADERHRADGVSRRVTDVTGRAVMVPENPQRIAVLSGPLLTISLIELGAVPVASLGRDDNGFYQFGTDFIESALGENRIKPQGFGSNWQVDLEKLKTIKPDLIVGTEFDRNKVENLSTIAPVYLQKIGGGDLSGFAIEKNLADLTGRMDVFNRLHQDYARRIAAFRSRTADACQGKTYLLIMVGDQISMVHNGSSAMQVFADIGMKPYPAGSDRNGESSALMLKLSAEEFGRMNPDLLVLMGSWTTVQQDEQTLKSMMEKLVPLWEKFMPPAKEKRVLFLETSKVFTPSFASANHTLYALDKFYKERLNP